MHAQRMGVDPELDPECLCMAMLKAQEIRRLNYDFARCEITVEDFDAGNWRVRVKRLSDNDETTALVAKS